MEAAAARGAIAHGGGCEIYRPWHEFGTMHEDGVVEATIPGPRAMKIAAMHYPRWSTLGQRAKLQHARYTKVILGDYEANPDTRACDALVGWSFRQQAPREGIYGAHQTVRVAKALGVPWVDLYAEDRASEAIMRIMEAIYAKRGLRFGRGRPRPERDR